MKGKLDALSDAIIAIAITVLVLEINTPTSMEGMWQFAKEIFLFAQSFVVIANFWFERSQFFWKIKANLVFDFVDWFISTFGHLSHPVIYEILI